MKSFQKTRVILFALAIVFHFAASAAPISGKVADAGTGEAIIGATIYDARSHVGVTTDAEARVVPTASSSSPRRRGSAATVRRTSTIPIISA